MLSEYERVERELIKQIDSEKGFSFKKLMRILALTELTKEKASI